MTRDELLKERIRAALEDAERACGLMHDLLNDPPAHGDSQIIWLRSLEMGASNILDAGVRLSELRDAGKRSA